MAYTATQNTSGTYDIFQDGVKKSTGTADILGNYGLSTTQLSTQNATSSPVAPTATNTSTPATMGGYYTTGNMTGQLVNQPAPAPAPTTQPTTQAPTQTQQTTQQQPAGATPTQQSAPLTFNGSIVDLLNTAGVDSSFAARAQMAQQFGMQGYTGTASQNTDLAKKYLDAYNANKSTPTPVSGAQAGSQLSSYFQKGGTETVQDPLKSFYDQMGAMDPLSMSLFQQLSQVASTPLNQQSLTDFYKQEIASQGIPELNMELGEILNSVRFSEDDIREEIQRGGGIATNSQVQALAAARNKTLIRKADMLSSALQAKSEYVDTIVSLTQADRKQVSEDLDRKLGITQQLFTMSQQMNNAARENYKSLISNIGYDGLVDSISSPGELQNIARVMGMSPKMLMQLGSVKTTAQRAQELDEMNFQLSQDKFAEDKRQFGLQYALEQNKLAQQQAASTVMSPYTVERSDRNLQSVDELLPKVSSKTVGLGSLTSYIPGTDARNFKAEVDTLKANVAFSELTAMREASKTGGALGAISDRELGLLQSSLGALDTGQSPENFRLQLGKVKESIYRWNAQALSLSSGYDYEGMKNSGYSDEEIYNYLAK